MSVTYAFLATDPPETETEKQAYLRRQSGCVEVNDLQDLGPGQHKRRAGPVNYAPGQVKDWRHGSSVTWCLTCGAPRTA